MKPRKVPWFSYLLVIGGAVLMVLPFADMFFTSFKKPGEFGMLPYQFLPGSFDTRNYADAFSQLDMPKLFFNSVLMTAVCVLSVLITSSMAGYALAKLRFKGRAALFRFVLATMMFPPFLFLIPDFLILAHWPGVGGNDLAGRDGYGGLMTTYGALFLPFLVSGFGIFLMRQFIVSIPDEVLEAARMDGAGEWRTWWSVVVPQTKPALITLGLLTFVGVWNEYIWPLMISTVNPDLMTLPVGIQLLQSQLDPTRTQPLVMAGLVISTVPVLLVFLLFQKYYVRGMMLSGMK
ncbi:MAG TPA: carbohydrate ABC transporter permease [Stackebrandtia sp.]|uniref:carbohydrate ABC transporter permease n=1 Tax=Stackebrandtia sp. TaxID=2023065 RepID=UPI002D6FD514|nr:carbohydrate ABC transporter permease [Stackebrandtia sp.]HZE38673.1 carbohydrate ABC transporter permease [Stackebrandtia sp.]